MDTIPAPSTPTEPTVPTTDTAAETIIPNTDSVTVQIEPDDESTASDTTVVMKTNGDDENWDDNPIPTTNGDMDTNVKSLDYHLPTPTRFPGIGPQFNTRPSWRALTPPPPDQIPRFQTLPRLPKATISPLDLTTLYQQYPAPTIPTVSTSTTTTSVHTMSTNNNNTNVTTATQSTSQEDWDSPTRPDDVQTSTPKSTVPANAVSNTPPRTSRSSQLRAALSRNSPPTNDFKSPISEFSFSSPPSPPNHFGARSKLSSSIKTGVNNNLSFSKVNSMNIHSSPPITSRAPGSYPHNEQSSLQKPRGLFHQPRSNFNQLRGNFNKSSNQRFSGPRHKAQRVNSPPASNQRSSRPTTRANQRDDSPPRRHPSRSRTRNGRFDSSRRFDSPSRELGSPPSSRRERAESQSRSIEAMEHQEHQFIKASFAKSRLLSFEADMDDSCAFGLSSSHTRSCIIRDQGEEALLEQSLEKPWIFDSMDKDVQVGSPNLKQITPAETDNTGHPRRPLMLPHPLMFHGHVVYRVRPGNMIQFRCAFTNIKVWIPEVVAYDQNGDYSEFMKKFLYNDVDVFTCKLFLRQLEFVDRDKNLVDFFNLYNVPKLTYHYSAVLRFLQDLQNGLTNFDHFYAGRCIHNACRCIVLVIDGGHYCKALKNKFTKGHVPKSDIRSALKRLLAVRAYTMHNVQLPSPVESNPTKRPFLKR